MYNFQTQRAFIFTLVSLVFLGCSNDIKSLNCEGFEDTGLHKLTPFLLKSNYRCYENSSFVITGFVVSNPNSPTSIYLYDNPISAFYNEIGLSVALMLPKEEWNFVNAALENGEIKRVSASVAFVSSNVAKYESGLTVSFSDFSNDTWDRRKAEFNSKD